MLLKEFAWRVFERTGNINAYMFYKDIQNNDVALNEKNLAEEEVAISG